ncbi:MAG TPA: nuclear transport factor 2 family protein [Steroidobacteraceae bacterium]|jgi:SnoaL-like domain|nr:nuclear transport factor 2 family protein [Steroidobacteraceae bacterium]
MKSFAKTRTLLAASLVLVSAQVSRADPPAGAQPAETQGGFLSSLRQAFGEDLGREVVRGHFDVGSPPDTRRYYCLVDPKTGKRESNGVSGETMQRRDGMTGIKSAVVSPLSCADAEQKGMLVTADYKLTGKAAAAASPPVPAPTVPPASASPAPAASVAVPAAAAPAAVPAAPVAPPASAGSAATSAATAPDDPERREVMGAFARFILAQNAHDSAALSDVLLDSQDFLWVQEGGGPIWGYQQALAAFEQAWKGTWRLDPQARGSRVANLSPGVRMLVTPLLLTSGAARRDPAAQRFSWSGVFVQTPSGWRIASIFVTPLRD